MSSKEEASKPFYLTGAGFSREISEKLPLLPELAEKVSARMGMRESDLFAFNGNIEQWMSHLATDQPWLAKEQSLENLARFYTASKEIYSIVSAAENEVMQDACPHWLEVFAGHVSCRSATVATLNYDTLLERTIATSCQIQNVADIYGMPLESRSFPGGNFGLSSGEPNSHRPIVYKLHGSTNWRYSGLDAPMSDRVVLESTNATWFGASLKGPDMHSRWGKLHADLSPYIVPPTATKTTYYGNLSMRAQWINSFNALRDSSEVVIMGFSFPDTDLAIRHYFTQGLTAKRITVVDMNRKLKKKIREITGKRVKVEQYTSLSEYALENCGSIVSWRIEDSSGVPHPQIFVNGASLPEVRWKSSMRESLGDESLPLPDRALLAIQKELHMQWGGALKWEKPTENGRFGSAKAYLPPST